MGARIHLLLYFTIYRRKGSVHVIRLSAICRKKVACHIIGKQDQKPEQWGPVSPYEPYIEARAWLRGPFDGLCP